MHVDFKKPQSLMSIFYDKSLPLILEMTITLHRAEIDYLRNHAGELFRADHSQLLGGWSLGTYRSPAATQHLREMETDRETWIARDLLALETELQCGQVTAKLAISPGTIPEPKLEPSIALPLLFSYFRPAAFGVIDYHGPHRIYNREPLNSINVDISSIEQQRVNSLLYNYTQKYQNIKNEMAGLLLRDLVAKEARADAPGYKTLISTLQELFAVFFPGKTFRGPVPTSEGSLTFPVEIAGGASHDIDELSAGEKEILYGYLRMRSSAHRNSIILIDEPELHLNPSLTRKLPEFYHRNLASNLDNQVWLVSHSDALLRDILSRPEYSVFHMRCAGAGLQSQSSRIEIRRDLDSVLFNLIGSIPGYHPGAPLVIFEGHEEASFDVQMTTDLFPEFSLKVNLVGARDKISVSRLHALLDQLSEHEYLPFQVFSITDKDSGTLHSKSSTALTWDVYHIENYLLNTEIITEVVNDLNLGQPCSTSHIEATLKQCALECISKLVRHDVTEDLSDGLRGSIELRVNAKEVENPAEWSRALEEVLSRVSRDVERLLNQFGSDAFLADVAKNYKASLDSDQWTRAIRGRDILRKFCGKGHTKGTPYVVFRNLIISKMRDRRFRPSGMERVLRQVIDF